MEHDNSDSASMPAGDRPTEVAPYGYTAIRGAFT